MLLRRQNNPLLTLGVAYPRYADDELTDDDDLTYGDTKTCEIDGDLADGKTDADDHGTRRGLDAKGGGDIDTDDDADDRGRDSPKEGSFTDDADGDIPDDKGGGVPNE